MLTEQSVRSFIEQAEISRLIAESAFFWTEDADNRHSTHHRYLYWRGKEPLAVVLSSNAVLDRQFDRSIQWSIRVFSTNEETEGIASLVGAKRLVEQQFPKPAQSLPLAIVISRADLNSVIGWLNIALSDGLDYDSKMSLVEDARNALNKAKDKGAQS